jgi:hypothetical protein
VALFHRQGGEERERERERERLFSPLVVSLSVFLSFFLSSPAAASSISPACFSSRHRSDDQRRVVSHLLSGNLLRDDGRLHLQLCRGVRMRGSLGTAFSTLLLLAAMKSVSVFSFRRSPALLLRSTGVRQFQQTAAHTDDTIYALSSGAASKCGVAVFRISGAL